MKSGLLRGREHTLLGGVAAIAEGRAAVALSRGGAAKRYRYRHPNEDAAAFADGEGGIALAVADGHWGCEAAELALETWAERFAPPWTARGAPMPAAAWPDAVRDAVAALNRRVHERLAVRGESPRSTLALALARPVEGWLGFGAVGDSHVFRVSREGAVDLATPPDDGLCFLGDDEQELRARCVAGARALAGTRALVLASDGLSERGIGVDDPEAAVGACADAAAGTAAERRALELARGVVERALAAQRRQEAGDNVACAAAWLEDGL